MKKRQNRLAIDPIDGAYLPGYPRRLTPAEYRALVEPRLRLRLHHAALSATLALSAARLEARQQEPAAAAGEAPRAEAPAEREARVLALLTDLLERGRGSWYASSSFGSRPKEGTGAAHRQTVFPAIPIMYGNSYNGVFDSEMARRAALDLFRAYGLEPAEDVRLEGAGFAATVDGYDEKARLGFEIRGGAPGSTAEDDPFEGDSSSYQIEKPEDYLDDAEAEALHAAGERVSVADGQPCYDGDRFTPVLALLAGLVDFLNAHTDGPDLDLSAILWQEKLRLHVSPWLTAAPSGDAFDVTRDGRYLHRTFERPATMKLEFNGEDHGAIEIASGMASPWDAAWKALDQPLSTAGAPAVISHKIYGEDSRRGRPAPPLRRIVQSQADGPPIRIETRADTVFLPSCFDAARPFSIELEFEPGTYDIGSFIQVGARSR